MTIRIANNGISEWRQGYDQSQRKKIMGYDIYIGNATMEEVEQYEDEEVEVTPYYRDIDGKRVYFKPRVDEMKQEDAPVFPNDPTENGNDRHPSYTAWGDFCEKTGLYHLFFDEPDGLMCEHPGFKQLTRNHAIVIQAARQRWEAEHPNAVPGFEHFSWQTGTTSNMGYDATLARLIWLDWWVQWTLKNCEHAGIYNF